MIISKRMDTPLNNVTTRRSMRKNARTVTRRVAKKMSAGRNKKITKINKRKGLVSLKRYIMTIFSLAMTHLRAKIKKIDKKRGQMFVTDSGSTPHTGSESF